MAFTMHSHSGQFCPGHAKDQLEEIIQKAIEFKMSVIAITEHMPRTDPKDLYPEEIEAGTTISPLPLLDQHETYVKECVRLREKYKSCIKILIGFEGEWIRPTYAKSIQQLMLSQDVAFFLGSVHHVHEIPIDYDRTMYEQARHVAGGTDEKLFEDYFDSQYEMLKVLQPKIVAHFDLIRLFSDDPNQDLKLIDGVWIRIVRNLNLIKDQGGLLEINSSALRKGLKEPYPTSNVCKEFLKIGGMFTLSDDSHGVAQIGLNFQRSIKHLESVGVQDLYHLELEDKAQDDSSKPHLLLKHVPLKTLDVEQYPSTAIPL